MAISVQGIEKVNLGIVNDSSTQIIEKHLAVSCENLHCSSEI